MTGSASWTGWSPRPIVERAEQFQGRLAEIGTAAEHADSGEADIRNRAMDAGADDRDVKREVDGLNAELVTLRSRRSSIPARNLEQ